MTTERDTNDAEPAVAAVPTLTFLSDEDAAVCTDGVCIVPTP